MKVIWKRPDGFHGASPSDYFVVQVANNSKIWLHKTDDQNFPFRVSGGWQDEDATKDLNKLVNLLTKNSTDWKDFLSNKFNDSKAENLGQYVSKIELWIGELKSNLKGDVWEMEIMTEVLEEVQNRLAQIKH